MIKLLGCFLLIVTIKEENNAGKETQGKLMNEGCATLLKNIIKNDHCSLIIGYASLG
jgi:hypothetical protein